MFTKKENQTFLKGQKKIKQTNGQKNNQRNKHYKYIQLNWHQMAEMSHISLWNGHGR